MDELVNDPGGRKGDELPDYLDSIGKERNKDKEVQLLMQGVPRGDGELIWKVSNSTGSLIPELYAIHGYPPAIEKLRRSLKEKARASQAQDFGGIGRKALVRRMYC